MSTRSLLRRPVALLAATALAAGGLATGMLASPAYAAPGDQPLVSTVTPNNWDNRSSVTVQVSGQNFSLTNAGGVAQLRDTVILRPAFQGPEVKDIAVQANQGGANDTGSLSATFNLVQAPPGAYRLIVRNSNNVESASPMKPNFGIFSYGPANATSVVHGADSSGADPFGADCQVGVTVHSCVRGATALDITGSNIARGAQVVFLTHGTDQADGGLTFAPGNATVSPSTGYPSSSLLQGDYTAAADKTVDSVPGFTPGLHDLQIVNTDGLATGRTTPFSQPWFATSGVSPSQIGAGAGSNGAPPVTLTITGQGIIPGSRIVVQNLAPSSSCDPDVTVGPSAVDPSSFDPAAGTYTRIRAQVSLPTCAKTGYRTVSILGPDGAVFSRNALSVTAPPQLTSVQSGYAVLGQGAHVGFGPPDCSNAITIQGTNFAGSSTETDPAKMVRFDFGPKITVTTCRVTGPTSAQVSIDVLSDAPTGDRVALAINPDGGAKSTARGTTPAGSSSPLSSAPMSIDPGPQITAVSPASFPTTTAISKGVTVTGSGFTNSTSSTAKPLVTITPDGISISPGSVSVASDGKSLTFTASTTNATPGPRDLYVEKADDHGRAVCVACLGVDSLEVTQVNGQAPAQFQTAQAPNSSTSGTVLTLHSLPPDAATGAAQAVPGGTVTLYKQVAPGDQAPIQGTSLTVVDAHTIKATFDLLHAATGAYNAKVVAGSASWNCTGCFLVSGDPFTTTKIVPAALGQGATDVPVTITGTNFSRGMALDIPNVQVSRLTFKDPQTLTALLSVASDASTGKGETVTVTAGDGSTQKNLKFDVNPKPTPTAINPASRGEGAGSDGTTVTLTVNGATGSLQDNAALDLGPGITTVTKTVTHDTSLQCTNPISPSCSDDILTATAVIAQDATTGKRDVRLVNPDHGTGVLSQAFTVNAGPKVTSVSNENGAPVLTPDGVTHNVAFFGTGFATADPKTTLALKTLAGTDDSLVKVANVVVGSGKITADVTVDRAAALAGRRVVVGNPGDNGYGTCDTCVAVASAPSVVTGLGLAGVGSGIQVGWTGPTGTSNGAPVTDYHVSVLTPAGASVKEADVPAGTLGYTATGLVSGQTYLVRVRAVNVAGPGPEAAGSAVAGLGTSLTSVASARSVTAGSAVRFSGKLVSGSAPVSGATIWLSFVRTGGSRFTGSAATNAAGGWSYVYVPTVTFTMTAAYLGNADNRAAAAPSLSVPVLAKVVVTSPSASVVRSRAATTLRIGGYVGPNKRGKTVYLFRYVGSRRTLLARAVLSSSSTYSFPTRLGRGTYYVRVYIPATSGNAAGYSRVLTIRRV